MQRRERGKEACTHHRAVRGAVIQLSPTVHRTEHAPTVPRSGYEELLALPGPVGCFRFLKEEVEVLEQV
jgi:hypothetical protein